MSVQEVDAYIAGLDEPKRSTLTTLREEILSVIPDAEQGISYGMPAFRLDGKVVAGFAAFSTHLSYLPHSGSVLGQMADELAGYRQTAGSLHFAVDQPLPRGIVARLIEVKRSELRSKARS